MWEENRLSSSAKVFAETKHYDAVFNDLMQECKHSAPGARLSARLRAALERMRPTARRALVSRTRDGCAPLLVASRRGNVELVEYLVHVCDAPLEQRGVYEVPHDRSTHAVTPLWCAAVADRLEVVRALADAGADLDAPSDSGSTPVRSACFMTHLDVVRLLVERGADIHRANHNGGTCLINAVQSVPLCALLLSRGAAVDARDAQLKTALHYAAQEHRLETARLLLDHGADPRLRSRAGDDALRTACLKGSASVVALLLERMRVSPARAADAYELLGATQLDEFHDVPAALASWRRATAMRARHGAEKRGHVGAALALGAAALEGTREWRTSAALEEIAEDMDALCTQSLLVAVRVLGAAHGDALFRLMYRGAADADALRYRRCAELWTWALRVRIERDSLLAADTCQTASALTRLLLEASVGRADEVRDAPRPADALRAFSLLADGLVACRDALAVRPMHRRQAEAYDRALRCATHLLYAMLRWEGEAGAAGADGELASRVRRLVAADVRSAHTGDTLLHLCASRLNVVRSTYFAEARDGEGAFPSADVARLLLRCGADPCARNEARSTALHVACVPYNFSTELVETLLAGGAHLDQPNKFGDSAAELLALNRESRVRLLRHVSLACLAARALLASGRPVPRCAVPRTLFAFIELHRP